MAPLAPPLLEQDIYCSVTRQHKTSSVIFAFNLDVSPAFTFGLVGSDGEKKGSLTLEPAADEAWTRLT